MNEILEEIEIQQRQKRYSKLSVITSLVTLALIGYLALSIPKRIMAREGLPEPNMLIIIVTQIFCLIGIALTVLSITKKEPSTWFKWIGGVLNVLLFLLIVGSAIFARVV
jgi:cytochrome bd-type quinol oxidase subunit 2